MKYFSAWHVGWAWTQRDNWESKKLHMGTQTHKHKVMWFALFVILRLAACGHVTGKGNSGDGRITASWGLAATWWIQGSSGAPSPYGNYGPASGNIELSTYWALGLCFVLGQLQCNLLCEVISITSLLWRDHSLDAFWFANTTPKQGDPSC